MSKRMAPPGTFWDAVLSRRIWVVTVSALVMALTGALPCQSQSSVYLVGAGSTVPLPLYKQWSLEFNRTNRLVQMQYEALGTQEGIKLIAGDKAQLGRTDFSAGEVPLTDEQRAAGLLELPSLIIGIVPIYNVPGNPRLKFSGDLLAKIFLGQVKTWNSPQISRLNTGVSLPNLPIKVVYRSGGKGTNYVFSDFLSKANADFRSQVGRAASPKWPVGEPTERSSDMVDKIKLESGSIGYVELQYALTASLSHGLVQNAAGKYVEGSQQSILAACRAVEAPDWKKFSASLTNAPGADSYPIASFSWLYLRTSHNDARRQAALAGLLNWMYSSGQQMAGQQGYTQLPAPLLDQVKGKVSSLDGSTVAATR